MKFNVFAFFLTGIAAQGSTLSINMQNDFFGNSNLFRDALGDPLAVGDLVQLGYFEVADGPASDGDSFATFIPIDIALGIGASPGAFSASVQLDDAADVPETSSQTLQFGIRFFDASTEGTSSFYNTVTTSDWTFTFSTSNPPPSPSEMFLDPILGAGTVTSAVWEGGAASAFNAVVAVPEPGTSLSAILGIALLTGARRRR